MHRTKTNSQKDRLILFLDRVCTFLLALTPLLQHYRGIFVNASVSLLLVIFPYCAIRLIAEGKALRGRLTLVFPLILFFLYKVVDHGTSVTEAGQAFVVAVYAVAIAAGCFDTKFFLKCVVAISLTACVLIILQYICYYLLGFHLQCAPTSLLLERSQQWVKLAQTGRASITGRATRFYRPSAFFLAPSHMFLYLFTPFLITLLSPEQSGRQKRIALLLTCGLVLCTSGMGIFTTIGGWLLYIGKKGGRSNRFSLGKFFRPRNIAVLAGLAVIALLLYLYVPFFQNSITRVFGSGYDYTNAIEGRVGLASVLVKSMSSLEWLIGVSDNLAGIEFNMSGFYGTLYMYGILGLVISYWYYGQSLLRLKNQYFWVGAVMIVVSLFSAHTHSTFFMLYSMFIFTEGYREQRETVREGGPAAVYARRRLVKGSI